MNLKRSREFRLQWDDWVVLAAELDFDPYEHVDFSINIGGGDSIEYELLGDIPEREE